MFGIGIFELAVVLVVALLVLGPKQLPEAARALGRWFYQIKNTAELAKQEIEKEWGDDPHPDPVPSANAEHRKDKEHVPS